MNRNKYKSTKQKHTNTQKYKKVQKDAKNEKNVKNVKKQKKVQKYKKIGHQPLFELQTPDFAWKYVWTVSTNYTK